MKPHSKVVNVPDGCQESPGFILEVGATRKLWLTQAGEVTDVWEKRGVWPSVKAANESRDRFCED